MNTKDDPAAVEAMEDVCALPLVHRVAATLDLDPHRFRTGDPLPRGWHVCLFTVATRQSQLRPDGAAGLGVTDLASRHNLVVSPIRAFADVLKTPQFNVTVKRPNIFGDVSWCRGKVVDKRVEEGAHLVELEVRIENQLGDITADGNSVVELPSRTRS